MDKMKNNRNTKAYRLFMDSQKKILARKYPFLSGRQLQNKANEQWHLLYKRKNGKEEKTSVREPSKKYNGVVEVSQKATGPRRRPLVPKGKTLDYVDEIATACRENQGDRWDLVKKWNNWDVNMWTSGVATRRGYGGQSSGYHRRAPQIVEDDPWHNQQGILTRSKPGDEKKKVKCSVSFFDMAVTHHYPAMSPGTPPSHKVFTFSAEERARIQKVLKRSQQQDTPVLKVGSPKSVVSTSSEDDDEIRDSVLLKYNHVGKPGSPVFIQSNVLNNIGVEECVRSHPVTPRTPQVDLSLSPRVMLAGLTPATSILPKSQSPTSSSISSLSSASVENAGPLSQESILSYGAVDDLVKRSPVKRKSPNNDVDNLATSAKSKRKSIKSGAMRKIVLTEENKTGEEISLPQNVPMDQQLPVESKRMHSAEMSKLYETMFGFLTDGSQVSHENTKSKTHLDVNNKQPQRTSPRKANTSPQGDFKTGSIGSNLNTTPTHPASTSFMKRTPFRTLVFDTLQAGVVGKPPSMPSSVKRSVGRVKNGGISKPSTKDNFLLLTASASCQSLTPSRSSRRLLPRNRSEHINAASDLSATPELSVNTLQGSNIKQIPSSSKSKTLSRSNGLTSLSSMQPENKLTAKLECPPSPQQSGSMPNSVRNSPRRSVLSSPKLPVRSSPRKSNSVPVLTENTDVLNNNKVCQPTCAEGDGKIARKEQYSKNTVDDTVQKMRNAVFRESSKGLSDFIAGTRTPSECSQVSDISSIASGDSELGDFEPVNTEWKTSKHLNKLSAEVGTSVISANKTSSRRARSPMRNPTPHRISGRRSTSWSAPRQPPSGARRNCSATRVRSPKKVQEKAPVPKLIVTDDEEVLHVNGSPARAITKKQREDFLCNLFVDLTPPSKQTVRRRVLKSCVDSSRDTFEQFLKGTGDADIFF